MQCPHKNLHGNASINFTHNCQNFEATQMPFKRWMVKKLYQFMEYLSGIERNKLLSESTLPVNLISILLNERSHFERLHTLFPFLWHFGKDWMRETENKLVDSCFKHINMYIFKSSQALTICQSLILYCIHINLFIHQITIFKLSKWGTERLNILPKVPLSGWGVDPRF